MTSTPETGKRPSGPWTIEELLRVREPKWLTVAADGTECVYSLRTLDADSGQVQFHLWRLRLSADGFPACAPPAATQLTHGRTLDTHPLYSPRGNGIVFLREPADTDDAATDGEQAPSLYFLPLDGGEARPLRDNLAHIVDFVFRPDGDALYVIADALMSAFDKQREKVVREEKRDVTHEERVAPAKQIWLLHVHGGGPVALSDVDYGLRELDVSVDGSRLVYSTNHSGLTNDEDEFDLYLLEQQGEGEHWASRALVQRPGACRGARFSADGRHVAYVAPRGARCECSQADVWLVSVDAPHAVRNLSAEASLAADAVALAWVDATALLVHVEQGLYNPLLSVTFHPQRDDSTRAAPLCSGRESLQVFAASRDGQTVIASIEDAYTPPELFASAVPAAQWRQVTDLQGEWADKERGLVQPFSWVSPDGWQQEGVLVLPADAAANAAPPPLILTIHGGPASHTSLTFSHGLNWHWLAGLGYAVFAPNYRGGTGYGDAYIQANQNDLGGGDALDILSGVDALIACGRVDGSRMGIVGGSYGGYMTNWIVGHDQRFRAAVSEFGIWSLLTDFGCSSGRSWELQYFGHYWDNEGRYLERSPARYVTQIQTPVLLLHGDADDNTSLGNSREMYHALLEAGKTVEFVHYPREGHGIREPRHRQDEMRRIATWFGHFLPTPRTERRVACGTWHAVGDRGIELRVIDCRAADADGWLADNFTTVLAVRIEWRWHARGDVGRRRIDHMPSLCIGNPERPQLLLAWSGTRPGQRPSLVARIDYAPVAVDFGCGAMVTDTVQLRLTGAGGATLLFQVPAGALLGELLLTADGVDWALTAAAGELGGEHHATRA